MTRAILCLLLALPTWACSSEDAPTDRAQPPEVVPTAEPPPAPAAVDPLDEHMEGHFKAIGAIQRAVVDGDMQTLHKAASWLSRHEPHGEIAWKPELERVKALAEELINASDGTGAAIVAARLAGSCGNCHTTTTTITSFPYVPLPDKGAEPGLRMQRHRWAVDRLWEGLVGPSDSAWSEGTAIIAAAPLPAGVITKDPNKVEQVRTLAKRLQSLGAKAGSSSTQSERVEVYGALLQTCAACHGVARKKK